MKFVIRFIILSATLLSFSKGAFAQGPDRPKTDSLRHSTLQTTEKKPLWGPVLYTYGLLGTEFGTMYVFHLFNDQPSSAQFKESWQLGPVLDNDHWIYNYALHPLMGSESYLRIRDAGYHPAWAVGFNVTANLTWEFLMESWTERPSIQDLIVTSTAGPLLGEIRYQVKRKLNPRYKWLVDPIYTPLSRLWDKPVPQPESQVALLKVL